MRLIVFMMLPTLTFAAPVPKDNEKSNIELKLSATTSSVLEITIHNNGKETLELPYRASPFEHLVVDIRGEQGKTYKFEDDGKIDEKAKPGTLSIPAGESKTLSLHTCHFLPEVGEPGQKITFTASLKHGGKTIKSEPLTVK